MSETTDYGRPVTTATPPVDALATVTAAGDPLTTVAVPAGRTLTLYVEGDERDLDDLVHTVETDDVPDPAHTEDLEDAHDTRTLSADSWVTVVVGDDRRLRFAEQAGTTLAVYLERAELPDN